MDIGAVPSLSLSWRGAVRASEMAGGAAPRGVAAEEIEVKVEEYDRRRWDVLKVWKVWRRRESEMGLGSR